MEYTEPTSRFDALIERLTALKIIEIQGSLDKPRNQPERIIALKETLRELQAPRDATWEKTDRGFVTRRPPTLVAHAFIELMEKAGEEYSFDDRMEWDLDAFGSNKGPGGRIAREASSDGSPLLVVAYMAIATARAIPARTVLDNAERILTEQETQIAAQKSK